MNLYIADMHFGHGNIIRFDHHPFADSDEGWDYPPKMGSFGVISPRTCGDCNMTKTLWWALVQEKNKIEELSPEQLVVLKRIQNEPASIIP